MQVSCGQEYNVSWLWTGIQRKLVVDRNTMQVSCGLEYNVSWLRTGMQCKLAVDRNTMQLAVDKNTN